MFFYLDLGIRVTALEEGLSEHSVAITNLQETDIGFEQRIGDLEDKILRNYFVSNFFYVYIEKFYFEYELLVLVNTSNKQFKKSKMV